jgi:NADH-quinone oxidoreductase subunit N
MQRIAEVIMVLPELFVAGFSMFLLLLGAMRGDGSARAISWLSVLTLVGAAVLLLAIPGGRTAVFGGQYIVDEFAMFMKWLVLIGAALAIIMSIGFNEQEKIGRPEYPVLTLFAVLGMLMMVSANDLISLYVGIELQSLALYVLAAYRRDSLRSSEAGLKYFVLGALSSGMLLYGCSLVYGFTGSTRFEALAFLFRSPDAAPGIGFVVGLVFVLAGLAFKVSAVPFHMWTPDVYEGAPTPVTAFFAVAPKIAGLALFVRVMIGPFGNIVDQWQQVVSLMAVASMLLGALAAIWQTNIKRLLAYSSIGHVGFALVGLASASSEGVRGLAIYLAIYLAMNVGTFCCVLAMRRHGRMVEAIADLSGLARNQPGMALALAVFMFSMAGIPPLAGFFGKLYVFLAAIHSGLYVLAVVGVLASVISAFYYLRIIKIMYFDDPAEQFERPVSREIGVVMTATALFTAFFFVYPGPVLSGAEAAASILFAG